MHISNTFTLVSIFEILITYLYPGQNQSFFYLKNIHLPLFFMQMR